MNTNLRLFFLCLNLLCMHFALAQDTGSSHPNIVYLLADDLGWGDISIHKGATPTPSIDKLFNQGVRLNSFMGWCVCSPTRAMLLTARHPFRVGTGPETGGELSPDETTIAEAFKSNGYATGVFGKWHNGENPTTPEYEKVLLEEKFKTKKGLGVNTHGFDEAWVFYGGAVNHFDQREQSGKGPVSWWHNLDYHPNGEVGYTNDLVTKHALEFINKNKSQPFFCYVPFPLVHDPLLAKEEYLKIVDPVITDEKKKTYSAMLMALDKNVGMIIDGLTAQGLMDNTIVVFTSDNGATQTGNNLPYRGGKHSLFEGGTRLPTTIYWKKGGLVGGKSWDGLCGALDMFPTLMAMSECKMPETKPLDGKNIWPALQAYGESPVDNYYWSWTESDSIRTQQWKMHRYSNRIELYDVVTDEAEAKDVAKEHPEVVKALVAKMDNWIDSMGSSPSHLPPAKKYDAPAQPNGEILEVSAKVNGGGNKKEPLAVIFAQTGADCFATDFVEFDIAYAPDSAPSGFFYSGVKKDKKDKAKFDICFLQRGGVFDQFGHAQGEGPSPIGGPRKWEHRVVGLCSYAPGIYNFQALVFPLDRKSFYRVWIDNLRIRHADGTTTNVWSKKEDTKLSKVPEAKEYSEVNVRTVNLADVMK